MWAELVDFFMEALKQPPVNQARRGDQSSIALKAALRIGDQWGLTEQNIATLLGAVPLATLRRWKRQLRTSGTVRTQLTRDQMDRISYLLGIFKALRILFPDANQANSWVKRANKGVGFNGRSALDVMLQGGINDLQTVRRYLDAWRGW